MAIGRRLLAVRGLLSTIIAAGASTLLAVLALAVTLGRVAPSLALVVAVALVVGIRHD